ncbi:hypothetical protein I551_7582 [Mycobacterium ulcerans str. Harvey]|uniref:Uncharacterized protein n=1 Tax=Mycobacterium ulcerans str. Harvey TaxID=1299332 RepID=A0ABN0QMU2_MYCUL|nr:hypothetical protein I551_7582 [Mycobacterium ulcerans str. Harvey]
MPGHRGAGGAGGTGGTGGVGGTGVRVLVEGAGPEGLVATA